MFNFVVSLECQHPRVCPGESLECECKAYGGFLAWNYPEGFTPLSYDTSSKLGCKLQPEVSSPDLMTCLLSNKSELLTSKIFVYKDFSGSSFICSGNQSSSYEKVSYERVGEPMMQRVLFIKLML